MRGVASWPSDSIVLLAEQTMGFRVAKSLNTLLAQVDARAPNRDKSSDGTIGDQHHQARNSDHNPNAAGVVTAMDITNDPAHGADSGAIAEMLRLARDPRIKYVISNRRIFSSQKSPWQWRPYTGINAHTKHVHISVSADPALYDATDPWTLENLAVTRPQLDTPPAVRSTDVVATVFGGHADPNMSAYDGHMIDDHELGVALPSRFSGDRPKVRVTNAVTRKSVDCSIVDIGPWNISDPYWETGDRPQAESGIDMKGRKTNLAGIDLTPGAASAVGISGKGKVDWEFVTGAVAPKPALQPQALLAIVQILQKFAKDGGIKMPLPAEDVSALLQQLFKLLQNLQAPVTSAPTPTPPTATEPDDPNKKIIDLIAGIIVPAMTKQAPQLGQVNGALGQGIGNLLDGKKTAIGAFGSLLTTILPVLTAPGGLLSGVLPALGGLSGVGTPIFLAVAAWGVLGKLEKWAQGNVPLSK